MSQLSQLDLVLFGVCFALAATFSVTLTPLIGRWATAHGVVARPRQDRWHQQPTPLLGGVAIYFAASLAILAFLELDTRVLGLLAGGTILFVVGLIDDLHHLRPHVKLIVQILAACALLVSGVRVETSALAALSIPLVVLWVVGITNAFNLLDNMDGLSSGTAAIASFFLFAFSVSVGNVGIALLSLALMGAALGFLVHNFNPARIFMGDSGSMFLGFMLAGTALIGTREMASDIFFVLLVPAAMMGLPIFDTTLVTVLRTLEGRPVSQGGRDHLSHRLVALGLSERQAVLLLYLFAASFGSLGLIVRSVGMWASLAAAGVLVVAAVIFGAYLAQVRLYGPAEFAREQRGSLLANRPIVNGMIMFKRELSLAVLDFALICLAYLAAYLLRFGMQGYAEAAPGMPAPWPAQFSASLPYVVGVKLLALLGLRAYRGLWRYMGMADVLTLARASLLGSLVLAFLLPLVVPNTVFPKSVMIIDWLVFTTVIIGSRLSFSALTEGFARLQRERIPNVLIVGAGDLGEIVLRSLLHSRPATYQAVGFLDPDAGKRRRSIHGVRVLGTLDDLEESVVRNDVDAVVLATPGMAPGLVQDLGARCEELGVRWYEAGAFVQGHFAGQMPPHSTELGRVATPSVN